MRMGCLIVMKIMSQWKNPKSYRLYAKINKKFPFVNDEKIILSSNINGNFSSFLRFILLLLLYEPTHF